MSIAVLNLDSPIPGLAEKYGDFGEMGERMLRAGFGGETLEFVPYTGFEKSEHPTLDELRENRFKAVYLSGSRSDSFDDSQEWIRELVGWLKDVLAMQRNGETAVKLVGVCFGHQVIARALGMEVGRNPQGWELGVTSVKAAGEFVRAFGMKEFSLVEMHQDIVEIKDDKHNVGSSEKCACQGLYVPNHILTFQGHPEFSTEYSQACIKQRYESGRTTRELYELSERSAAALPNQGKDLAGIIAQFTLHSAT